jgi:glucans biosynthesis protein
VVATRIGRDSRNDARRQIVIDFTGPRLAGFTEQKPPESIANCSDNATLTENQIFRVPELNVWRVILKMENKPGNKEPVDLRCTLKQGEETLTETWTYHWSPP